jgi:hypothetical protein
MKLLTYCAGVFFVAAMSGHALAVDLSQAELSFIAKTLNNGLPKQMGSEVTLDNVQAAPRLVLDYKYTYIKYVFEDFDLPLWSEIVNSEMKQKCNDENFQMLLQQGVTVSYSYNGKDGRPIGSSRLTKSDCAKT